MKKRLLQVFVCLVALCGLGQAKQLAIIADGSNSTTSLTAAEVVKMFNAHTHSWPDGKPITIVIRDPSSPDMQMVLHKLFNMTSDQAHEFIQSHKGFFVVADSDDAVLRFVASTRGAIGVIDLYSLTKDVNVIKIDGKLPVEQGYLLRGN
jgi:ABC-type phosphate transport system substrate-binding protein